MNKFVIVGGLPYLFANGKTFSCRFDEKGFTMGAEVKLASVPTKTYSDLSIIAKCAGHLDSISASVAEDEGKTPETTEPDAEDEGKTPETTEPDAEDEQETDDAEEDAEPVSDELEKMTVDSLKQYASDNGIALNGARTKPAIIEAIKSASKE